MRTCAGLYERLYKRLERANVLVASNQATNHKVRTATTRLGQQLVVTKRIAALFGAVTLVSTLAACGGGPQEVDADEKNHSQASEGDEPSAGPSEEQKGDGPYDGSIVMFANLSEDNIDGLCTELFGEVDDVLGNIDSSGELAGSEFGDWGESYEDTVGHSEFGCHAVGSASSDNANNKDSMHIFVSSNLSTPGEVAEVTARSDTNEAAMSFDLSGIESSAKRATVVDETAITQFLENDVLPKFKP